MPQLSNSVLKPLVVYGAAGHAKVVFDIVEKQGVYHILAVLDRYKPVGTECGSRTVSGTMEDLPEIYLHNPDVEVIVAIGDNWARGRIANEILELCPEIRFGIAIHPSAQIGNDVSIGRGTVIMAGAVVNPSARVGQGCIINTRASLDHDSVMAHFSSLGPGAAIGGTVQIGAAAGPMAVAQPLMQLPNRIAQPGQLQGSKLPLQSRQGQSREPGVTDLRRRWIRGRC